MLWQQKYIILCPLKFKLRNFFVSNMKTNEHKTMTFRRIVFKQLCIAFYLILASSIIHKQRIVFFCLFTAWLKIKINKKEADFCGKKIILILHVRLRHLRHWLSILTIKLSRNRIGNNAHTWSNASSSSFSKFGGGLTKSTCLRIGLMPKDCSGHSIRSKPCSSRYSSETVA